MTAIRTSQAVVVFAAMMGVPAHAAIIWTEVAAFDGPNGLLLPQHDDLSFLVNDNTLSVEDLPNGFKVTGFFQAFITNSGESSGVSQIVRSANQMITRSDTSPAPT